MPYSSTPLLDDRLLLRDFIQNSLYHPVGIFGTFSIKSMELDACMGGPHAPQEQCMHALILMQVLPLLQTKGYFNRPKSVVGRLETPIDHWKVYCAEEWRMLINKKYKELEVRNSQNCTRQTACMLRCTAKTGAGLHSNLLSVPATLLEGYAHFVAQSLCNR